MGFFPEVNVKLPLLHYNIGDIFIISHDFPALRHGDPFTSLAEDSDTIAALVSYSFVVRSRKPREENGALNLLSKCPTECLKLFGQPDSIIPNHVWFGCRHGSVLQ